MAKEAEREVWSRPAEFILSCIGLTVGLGNFWKFPYVAYENGGSAFLIPYVFAHIICGHVILLLEIGLGQFTSRGPLHAFEFIPIGKGVALATIISCFYISSYFSIIVAYAFFYLKNSFYSPLPWSKCLKWWGATHLCNESRTQIVCIEKLESGIQKSDRESHTNLSFRDISDQCIDIGVQSPSQQFWDIYVTRVSKSIEEIGSPKLSIVSWLFITWTMLFLCLFKGLKLTGKVSHFTATGPYILLFIFAVHGLTLEGSEKGLRLLFIPHWDRLLDLRVWTAAVEQFCFSLGTSVGALTSYGSYNRFNYPLRKAVIIISLIILFSIILQPIIVLVVLVLKNYPDLRKLVTSKSTWGPANYDDYIEWTNYRALITINDRST
ncbi:SLC6A7 [Cordylochernes scorpioides]|uniref:SLC6A7 n=1 Tax=Cordylochernes scorpioides TaxID=51811 RepID=A0ABY6KY44_9ARAC|nr:SLC6A7 [Cordylochernes scorpioides]